MTEDTAATEQAQTTQQAQAETTEEPFDKDRAMALIAKLRDEAKDKKALEKRLAQIEADAKKRADSELSETERLKAELAETAAKAQAAEERLTAERRRSLVVTIASAMHANDPQDANVLQATASIDPDADDAETQVKKAIEALAKAKPYLFRQSGTAAFNPGGNGTETDRQRLDRLHRLSGQLTSPFG